MSGDFYATYPVQSGGGGSWQKSTLSYTDINTLPGTDTGQINVFAVPAGHAVIGIAYNVTTPFASAGTVSLFVNNTDVINGAYFAIGDTGVTNPGYSPSGPASGTASSPNLGPISYTLDKNITVEIIVATALSDLTAGSVDIYVQLQSLG